MLPLTDPAALSLRWLIKLRWAVLLSAMLAVPLAERALHLSLPEAPLLALLGVAAASNLAAWLGVRRATPRLIAAVLVVDAVLLTAALYFAGGVYNPFVLTYLALVLLSAALLGRRAAAAFIGLSAACVIVLAVAHRPLVADHHHHGDALDDHHHSTADEDQHVRVHAEGMWLAFGVLAALIAYLGNWAFRQREMELRMLRAEKERADRLASVGALVATAAHEITSPLTTIAVVSKELERAVAQGDALALDDVKVIRAEVDRVREALDAMAARARGDEARAEIVLSAVLEEARARAPDPQRVTLALDGCADVRVHAPAGALTDVLRGLIANACEASDAEVRLALRADQAHCYVDVVDQGRGIADADLPRVGREPFTTKGDGRGIGLFAGRAVVERLGGALELDSQLGRGTRVTLTLPLAKP